MMRETAEGLRVKTAGSVMASCCCNCFAIGDIVAAQLELVQAAWQSVEA